MKKLKTLEQTRNIGSNGFTILRDNYENIEKARAFNVGFDRGVETVNNWNELKLNDSAEYDSIGEPIPDSGTPILFKHEGTLTFYFAGYFNNNVLEINTNMEVTHWRYIEHP
jgi:hypothetical protein